jgi:hypothetical protein
MHSTGHSQIGRIHDLLHSSTQENKIGNRRPNAWGTALAEKSQDRPAVKARKRTHQDIWLCALEMLRDPCSTSHSWISLDMTATLPIFSNTTHSAREGHMVNDISTQVFGIARLRRRHYHEPVALPVVQTEQQLETQQLGMAQARYTLDQVVMAAGSARRALARSICQHNSCIRDADPG